MTRKAIQILVHVSGVVWGSGHSQTVVRGSTIPTMHTLFWRGLDPTRDLMGRECNTQRDNAAVISEEM